MTVKQYMELEKEKLKFAVPAVKQLQDEYFEVMTQMMLSLEGMKMKWHSTLEEVSEAAERTLELKECKCKCQNS